jgi:hypothetical protein
LLVHSACGSSHTRVGGTGPGADGGADGKSGAPGVSGVPGIGGTDGLDGQPGSPGRGTLGICARGIEWLVSVCRAVLCGAFCDVIVAPYPGSPGRLSFQVISLPTAAA